VIFSNRVPIDLAMVAFALVIAGLFVYTKRPWYQTGILVLVACMWGAEAAVLSSDIATKQVLYAHWHPVFAIITSAAVIALYLLRRLRPN
jgi:hypothetical protein